MASEQELILNAKFKENFELIENLQNELLKDVLNFNFSINDINLVKEYINDKVTIFRYLKESQYDYEKSKSNLIDTIKWRIENNMDKLDHNNCLEFVENGFAFFNGTDNSGDHPLVFVRLRFFPTKFREPNKSLTEQMEPFACYLLELTRRYTWDLTNKRLMQNHPNPLVARVRVIVNVAKAPLLPIDPNLIKVLGPLLGQHFPGYIASIHVLNFGWMYQGIWSVLKYLLSEKAKSFISFTSVKELNPLISEDLILKEMGGSNDYIWSFENDSVLQTFGMPDELSTPSLSRSSRSSSISDSSDEFYDAPDTFSTSIPLPHPIKSATTTTTTTRRIPNTRSLSLSNHSSSVISNFNRIELFFKKLIYQLFQLTCGPKKGLIYWVFVYILLRGPVERVIKRALVRSALVKSQRISSTAIGITAVVAALVGSGLERYRKH